MAATKPKTVIAVVSGYVGLNGKSVMVIAESVWDRNDPIVKAYPQFFDLSAQTDVIEQATAAPGELRGGKVA